jgi:uncharacterized protein YjbI with pentapeptide repeats
MALDGVGDVQEWWKKNGIGADLSGRSFKFAYLSEVDLRKTNFSDAMLQNATIDRVQMQNTNFDSSNLDGAVLDSVELQGASFRDTSLLGAHIAGSNLRGADFADIRFNKNTYFLKNQTDVMTSISSFKSANQRVEDNSIEIRLLLRDEHGLELPEILYEQLEAKEAKSIEESTKSSSKK